MWRSRLCMGTSMSYGIGIKEQIALLKGIGFDGYFVNWNTDVDVKDIKAFGDEIGMCFQSIHAPFGKVQYMWEECEEAERFTQVLIDCLGDCAANDVPIMVCHVIKGFDVHTPNDIGIKNFAKVVDKAEALGVQIAFENTEGEEYLEAIMKAFWDRDCVKFCWDTGHEMCYNHSKDMLALYGEKLICTHLNDNLGIKDFEGKTTWHDDLHLLPFDGIADWKGIADRMNRCGYDGMLTFELNITSKPNRHENDVYGRMDIADYFCEVYKRACKVAALKNL